MNYVNIFINCKFLIILLQILFSNNILCDEFFKIDKIKITKSNLLTFELLNKKSLLVEYKRVGLEVEKKYFDSVSKIYIVKWVEIHSNLLHPLVKLTKEELMILSNYDSTINYLEPYYSESPIKYSNYITKKKISKIKSNFIWNKGEKYRFVLYYKIENKVEDIYISNSFVRK